MCDRAGEELIHCLQSALAQMNENAALIIGIMFAHDQIVLCEDPEPAQSRSGRRGRTDARARNRDLLAFGMSDVEIEQDIPGRLAKQLSIVEDRASLAPRGIYLARMMGIMLPQIMPAAPTQERWGLLIARCHRLHGCAVGAGGGKGRGLLIGSYRSGLSRALSRARA